MLGVGETDDEVKRAMDDILAAGVQVITFGQYLRPTRHHMKVAEYVHPDKFEFWRQYGERLGFTFVASGPLVRSSYKAGELFLENYLRTKQQGVPSETRRREVQVQL
mmetsp:Transcript_13581/g.32122  ORF Transcript_13581/g.32122 Transcript_13581/m.32122 type:complete len:107 (+) Transcript_13581:124-444(+)